MRYNISKRLLCTWLGGSTLGLLAVVLVLALSSGTGVASPGYNPTADVTLGQDAPNANANIATAFDVPAGDLSYSTMIAYTPPEFYVAAAGDVPIGAVEGKLEALVTLGMLNQPCTAPLVVPPLNMLNCSINTGDTVSFTGQFVDANSNGIKDGCDKYPEFLNTMFPGKTPLARLWGTTVAAGTSVSENMVIFEPGTSLPGIPSLEGYPLVTVLNDPTAATAPSPITDFCAPLATDISIFGISQDNTDTAADEAGTEVRRNPECGGTYTFLWYTVSARDADEDGLDNSLDTCPFDPDVGADSNGNGIDDACDTSGTGTDVDADGYMNRGDNCPQNANANQADGDDDSIGDVCDDHPNTADGEAIEKTVEADAQISGAPCAATPTPAATGTPGAGTPTPTPGAGTPTPTATAPAMYCFPPFPGLYNGRVFIDGKLAQDGYLVTAKIGDIKWASAVVSGGRYSMNIPDYLPTEPPCFSAGTIVFELDGMTCTASASAEWASGGPYDVDLTCTPPAPTATSTPAATATVPPTATPTAKPSASPTATPAKLPPSGAGGFAGPSSGLPLWAMALAGWAGLTIVAGLGTLVAAKRR